MLESIPTPDEAVALVEKVAKKANVLWVVVDGRTWPVWFAWVDGAVCVVANGDEQPVAGLAEASVVTLMLRAKSTRSLVGSADAEVHVVRPGDEHWDAVTDALRPKRLNATSDDVVADWAARSTVARLVPVGRPTDAPARRRGRAAPRLAR